MLLDHKCVKCPWPVFNYKQSDLWRHLHAKLPYNFTAVHVITTSCRQTHLHSEPSMHFNVPSNTKETVYISSSVAVEFYLSWNKYQLNVCFCVLNLLYLLSCLFVVIDNWATLLDTFSFLYILFWCDLLYIPNELFYNYWLMIMVMTKDYDTKWVNKDRHSLMTSRWTF